MNRFTTASFATGLIIGSIFFSVIASAWTAPTLAAPAGNASAPVNLSATAQSKTGSLGVGGLAVFGNASITGNLTLVNTTGNGVDATGPSSGSSFYGVIGRAGSYSGALGRADGFSFVGVGSLWNQGNMYINGAGNGLTFPDGTVQTTAASMSPKDTALLVASTPVTIAGPFTTVQVSAGNTQPNGSSTFILNFVNLSIINVNGTWKYSAINNGSGTSGTLTTGVQTCLGWTPNICMTKTAGGSLTLTLGAAAGYGNAGMYTVY